MNTFCVLSTGEYYHSVFFPYPVLQVDRSVTGLIAQQQCVGPLHTPLADVAVTALSYWSTKGSAMAIGEQPIKMLVSNECGARMAVGEALTNLVFAQITQLKVISITQRSTFLYNRIFQLASQNTLSSNVNLILDMIACTLGILYMCEMIC